MGWFVAGSALTALAAAAFFVPWSSLVALVADINLNPFADTPDTIMTQEIPLLRQLTDLMEAAIDGGSLQDAAAKIKNLDGRVVDLYLRAVRVSPISHERLSSSSEKHRAEMDDFVNRAKDVYEKGRSQRRNATSPADQQAFAGFQSGYDTLHFHLQILNRTFATIMERPPTPQSKMGRTQREVIDNLREVVVLLSRIDSNSAALAARPALKQYKERLDDLRRRGAEEMAGESNQNIAADLGFDRFAASIRTEIAQVGEIVAERYSPGSDFQKAVAALAPLASMRRGGFANSPARGGPQRAATRLSAAVVAVPQGPAMIVRRAAPASQTPEHIHDESAGPAIPPFVPPNTSPGGFVLKCLREFGKENVVFLGFAEPDIPAREITRLLNQIQSDLGNVTTRSSNNKSTIIAIASSEELEALADKLHVGRIRTMDADNRRIYVALGGIVRKMSPLIPGARPHRPPALRRAPSFPRGNPTPPSNLGPAPGPRPYGSKSSGL